MSLNSNIIKYFEPYSVSTKDKLIENLRTQFGHEGSFDDDIWVNKNHASYKVSNNSAFCVRFFIIPLQFRNITKYYILRRMQTIGSMRFSVDNLRRFFDYIIDEFGVTNLMDVNYLMLEKYRDTLSESNYSVTIISGSWREAKLFFDLMADFDEIPYVSFPTDPDMGVIKRKKAELECKPEPTKENYLALDNIFIDYQDGIPIHIQLIYWLLRLIPTRINEVLDMIIDTSLRKVGNEYKVTIPIPKTSPDMQIVEKIITLTGKSEAEKHLIKLIEKQKMVALELQNKVVEAGQTEGLLFTVLKTERNHTVLFENISYSKVLIGRFKSKEFNRWLKKIIFKADSIVDEFENPVYSLRDDSGNICDISSHDYRHEGITDRINYGFETHKVMFFAGLRTEDTVFGYYTHRPETAITSDPIYTLEDEFSDDKEKLIRVTDIIVPEYIAEMDSKIVFQGNSNVDEVVLEFQVDIEGQSPIVTNEGAYLGNCPNFYNCQHIKKEINCIGCEYSADDIIAGGIENIEKAINRYNSDYIYYKESGNKRMQEMADGFLRKYQKLKTNYELRSKHHG